MIKVGARTYRVIWIACALLGLFLVAPVPVVIGFLAFGDMSVSINAHAGFAIIASAMIGAILICLSVFRLARPTRARSRASLDQVP